MVKKHGIIYYDVRATTHVGVTWKRRAIAKREKRYTEGERNGQMGKRKRDCSHTDWCRLDELRFSQHMDSSLAFAPCGHGECCSACDAQEQWKERDRASRCRQGLARRPCAASETNTVHWMCQCLPITPRGEQKLCLFSILCSLASVCLSCFLLSRLPGLFLFSNLPFSSPFFFPSVLLS